MATVRNVPEEQRQAERDAPRVERRPRYGQPFFPVVPFGSSIYILATAIALVVLAISTPAPLQNPADPLNHEHINPRPEWYFLFLFQILKIFQGPWEIVGTAVIPAIIGLILLGLPFYDRNWSRRAVRRPVAVSLASLAIIGLALLTYIPIASTPSIGGGSDYLSSAVANPTWNNIEAIFTTHCSGCHVGVSSPLGGLNLSTYADAIKGGTGGGPVVGPVIKPGNPDGSYLYQAVEWKQKVGASMPLGATTKIPAADRQNIYNWIKNGAKGP